MRIVGVGNCMVDMVGHISEDVVAYFSLVKGAAQGADYTLAQAFQNSMQMPLLAGGGSSANTLCMSSLLGAKTLFAGCVGEDDAGAFFIQEMHKAGVELSLQKSEKPTSRCLSGITPDGERTMVAIIGACTDTQLTKLPPIETDDLVLIEGYILKSMPDIAESIEHSNVVFSLSSHALCRKIPNKMWRMIAKSTLVLCNDDEATALTGKKPQEAIEEIALRSAGKSAVVTLGKEGVLVYCDKMLTHLPTQVVKALDTTGAGDAFAGGLLAGIARGYALEESAKLGMKAAGIVVSQMGARATIEQVKHL